MVSLRLIEPHDDALRAVHRNQFAARSSHLPREYFADPARAFFRRWRGWALALFVLALVGAWLTRNVLPNL